MKQSTIVDSLTAGTGMNNETENHFITLETKIAYLEDFITKLQEVVVQQGTQIEAMRQENNVLSGRFRELQDSLDDIPNRKPPHY